MNDTIRFLIINAMMLAAGIGLGAFGYAQWAPQNPIVKEVVRTVTVEVIRDDSIHALGRTTNVNDDVVVLTDATATTREEEQQRYERRFRTWLEQQY